MIEQGYSPTVFIDVQVLLILDASKPRLIIKAVPLIADGDPDQVVDMVYAQVKADPALCYLGDGEALGDHFLQEGMLQEPFLVAEAEGTVDKGIIDHLVDDDQELVQEAGIEAEVPHEEEIEDLREAEFGEVAGIDNEAHLGLVEVLVEVPEVVLGTLSIEDGLDRADDMSRVDGFADEVRSPKAYSTDEVLLVEETRHEDHVQVSVVFVAHPFEEVQPRDAGHLNVADDQVVVIRLDLAQSVASVISDLCLIPADLEDLAEAIDDGKTVVNDQYPCRFPGHPTPN